MCITSLAYHFQPERALLLLNLANEATSNGSEPFDLVWLGVDVLLITLTTISSSSRDDYGTSSENLGSAIYMGVNTAGFLVA
jgi:hypothetical protein